MLTHPTLDQMHQLGLAGMARALAERQANPQSADLSHAEWLGLLLDREATERYQRRLRARLRNRRFFSLAELNQAIGELVADLNARPMRRLGVSRRDLFVELDRPALKELPAEPYEYAEWRVRRVGLDYHVDIDGHYYSVPHRLIREQLDARITAHTIELFRKGERVAVHLRGAGRGRHTTIAEHMPSSHRRYAEWTIERIGREAAAIGPSTAKLAALILESRPHPEQGYRACLGILRRRSVTRPPEIEGGEPVGIRTRDLLIKISCSPWDPRS